MSRIRITSNMWPYYDKDRISDLITNQDELSFVLYGVLFYSKGSIFLSIGKKYNLLNTLNVFSRAGSIRISNMFYLCNLLLLLFSYNTNEISDLLIILNHYLIINPNSPFNNYVSLKIQKFNVFWDYKVLVFLLHRMPQRSLNDSSLMILEAWSHSSFCSINLCLFHSTFS